MKIFEIGFLILRRAKIAGAYQFRLRPRWALVI